jgi:hypothetical protein
MRPGALWITTEAELDEALRGDLAVLYKHSPRCGGSRAAAMEIQRFLDGHPAVAVYAAGWDERHDQKPQLLVNGTPVVRDGAPTAARPSPTGRRRTEGSPSTRSSTPPT